MSAPALWTIDAMATAMGAERQGALPQSISGISIDSRSVAPGEAFFAIHGDNRDGHEFVASGACGQSRRLRSLPPSGVASFPSGCAASRRAGCARGPARSRRRGTRAHAGQGHRRHRLGRQDQHQGSAAARAVERRRDPCLGRLLQQSLGRAAVARALSGERALRGARNGHESRRRDRAAVAARPPARRAHHDDRAGASRILRLAGKDRRRQGRNFFRRRAGRRRGHQSRHCAIRAAQAPRQGGRRRAHRIVRRACRGRCAPDQMLRCMRAARPSRPKSSAPNSATRSARRAATSSSIRSRCWRRPSWSAPISRSRRWRSPNSTPVSGRGAPIDDRSARRAGAGARRELQRQSRRRSRPRWRCSARRRSARKAGASPCSATCWNSGRRAGAASRRGRSVLANAVDLVFCCGPLMRGLVAGSSREPPRRLCRELRRARGAGAARDPCRRRRHGQGLARLAHGAHRQGVATGVSAPDHDEDTLEDASAQG